ncbi:MAG: hypothetical protein J1E05_08015 [Eubacterium sp.]|nr:hypothetical protein [Eubacterium sp.]
MPSDAQKKANRKWDKENMITLGCKVYRSDAELFKEYAAEKGKTSNTLLKEYVIECIKDKKQSDSTDNR